MSVQMRHRQWVDDGLLELLDDVVQPTNVIEADWDIFGGDDFKGDLILVLVENQVLWSLPFMPGPVCAIALVCAIASFEMFPP
jgi:hypothetical protein